MSAAGPPGDAADGPSFNELAAALREIERRYRTLAENAFDLICELDSQGRYLYLSPNHREILGWDPQQYLNTSCFEPLHPDDREMAAGELTKAISEGRGKTEVRVHHADGHWLWFECAGSTYLTAEGQPRAVLVARDVTHRRDAEARLRHERELLKRMLDVQERDRKLLAYEIHDGLVQELTAARMHMDVALRDDETDENRSRNLEHVTRLLERGIAEARRLINGLRPPVLDEVGVPAAIQILIDDIEASAELEIDYSYPDEMSRLAPTLENALYRIVQEALTNVRRHSGSPRARVELSGNDQTVAVQVQDWGVGFDPQAVSPQRYGLAGLRERARLLGGTSEVVSKLGQGTLVRAEFPIARRDTIDEGNVLGEGDQDHAGDAD